MGLFILPGRLKKQLNMIAEMLCKQEKYDEQVIAQSDNYLHAHKEMTKELLEEGVCKDLSSVEKRLRNE